MDLDLSEAIEAGRRMSGGADLDLVALIVRAAAPMIERAVRERVAADLEATFVTGAVPPPWAQAGGKPTARGIRAWAVGVALNGAADA